MRPWCLDLGAMEWAHTWQSHGSPTDKTGFIYMLAGDTGASNTDPYAKAKSAECPEWTGAERMARDDKKITVIKSGTSYPNRPVSQHRHQCAH